MMANTPLFARVFVNELMFDESRQTCSVNGDIVSKVELLGTVVYRSIRENVFVLYIDDGTGTIPCVQFQSENEPFPDHKVRRAKMDLQELYQASVSARDCIPELGACLHIRGHPSFFRGKPQVIINQLRIAQDCNEWWFRVLEVKASRGAAVLSTED